MPAAAAPTTTVRQSVRGAPAMQLLYVAENTLGKVDVYDAQKYQSGPIAQITDGVDTPIGICADSNGVAYVVNNDANSIAEYDPGQAQPFQTITDGLDFPEFCTTDRHGNLWVTNLAGSVVEYAKGATTPRKTITNGVSLPTGIAIDRSDDLYVAGSNAEDAYVAVYTKEGSSPNRTITAGIVDPDGISIDQNGTLYVTNLVTQTTAYGDVVEYKSGQSQPYQTIGTLDAPADVTIDKFGNAYVSESDAPAVAVFKPDWAAPWHEFQQGMNTPAGVALLHGTPP